MFLFHKSTGMKKRSVVDCDGAHDQQTEQTNVLVS